MRALLLALSLAATTCLVPARDALAAGPGAAAAVPQADKVADPRAAIAARIPGVKAEELRASPIAGIYELSRGADVTYVSADGRYIFTGDLYQIAAEGEFPNLSDARRRELRAGLMTQLPDSKLIVFAPKAAAKYTVTVFTDPDCAWCRKMHSQIADYNRLGIKVRYAFFPREGPDTEAWSKSEAVWCSRDRNDALTRAKLGQKVTATRCADTPVRASWELGHQIGIEGTPGVVLADGTLVPGYLPPQQLVERLAKSAAPAARKPVASAPQMPARR